MLTKREIKHGILVTLLLAAVTLLCYLGDISWFNFGRLGNEFFAGQAYHELCLLLLTGPVIYASIIFRIKGGIIASLVIAAAILPDAFFFSPYSDPFYRLITFTFISMLMAGFIGSQLNNRERFEKEQARLQHFLSETIDVQEREKQYLARELHDESLQFLVDISHNIDELEDESANETERAKLTQLHSDVESVIEGTRRFIQGLRPPLLEEVGLAMSLKWLVGELPEDAGIDVLADVSDAETELSGAKELTLFRIAQEAINNAKKHSMADKIEISLHFADGQAVLRVADNGRGFSVPSLDKLAEQRRFGLIGMQERARLAGGSLRIESAEGKGTVITAVMPAN